MILTRCKTGVSQNVSEEDDIVLINCAGINYNSLARRAYVDDWMHVIDINLGGTFRAINAVLPFMYKKALDELSTFHPL